MNELVKVEVTADHRNPYGEHDHKEPEAREGESCSHYSCPRAVALQLEASGLVKISGKKTAAEAPKA